MFKLLGWLNCFELKFKCKPVIFYRLRTVPQHVTSPVLHVHFIHTVSMSMFLVQTLKGVTTR